jgi:serine phosphatase RsbU (regulator of sigma subunit)
MSIIGNDLLAEIVLRHGKTEPGEILSALNIEVRRVLRQGETQNRDGMDAAFCAWNPETKQLKFAGAKNPLWMVVKSQEPELIKGSRYPIGGAQSEDATFPTHVREISEPTWVYLYSDGFQDQFGGPKGKKFMSKRFRKLLAEGATLSAEAQQTRLEETLSAWLREGHEEQVDDILVMGICLP